MRVEEQQQQNQQHLNHKYNEDPNNEQSGTQIYSTSANQGSVNYVPADEHYLAAKAFQQEQQVDQGGVSKLKRAEKRFGARLLSKPNQNKQQQQQRGNKARR